jgi:hypothetical protein
MLMRMPTVMLSSTIGELAKLRADVGRRVEEAGMATAWRFEVHAVAAGSPPEEQYLGIATMCDLYIVIVASQQSDATEAEYQSAYADNPDKILAFFVGDGTPAVAEFRALIESRHTRVQRPTADALVEPITNAILEAVSTGRLVGPSLLHGLDQRIDRARTAIAPVPLLLEPRISADGNERRAREMIDLGQRIALFGIGGSGKTLTATISGRRASAHNRALPIYAIAAENQTDPIELVRHRLDAARFRASVDLVESWSAEGRIMLIVDGAEGLTAVTRRRLMSAVSAWAERFPRCGVVVCARRFSPLELPGFARIEAAPLGAAQMRDLTESLGFVGGALHFSDQVRDLAMWPMWTTALIVYGTESRTGLELLQRLVDTRLQSAGMTSPVEVAELRAVAGFIANRLWPATETTASWALERIRQWRAEVPSAATFEPRTPEDILQRLGDAALLEVGADIAFPHRLISTILAAEYAVSDPASANSSDEELAPFVAALADDGKHLELIQELLENHDIFVLARFLRLSPSQARLVDWDTDVTRLANAFRLWSPSVEELDVAFDDRWIAWRTAHASRVWHAGLGSFDEWSAESDEVIEFWPSSPFKDHTPEFVAAVYILARFRKRVLELYPGGEGGPTVTPDELRALLRDEETLKIAVVEVLRRRRDFYRDLVAELDLENVRALEPPQGEPMVTIWKSKATEPTVNVVWNGRIPEVEVVTTAPGAREGWTGLLADLLRQDDRTDAYADLERRIEAALGCRLGAQSWSRPELVPAWVW